LKLTDQGLIEPLKVWKNVDTMGISAEADFEIIDPKEGSQSLPTLVGRPWGRKMKASISLEKEQMKLKGKGKKVIIPLDPTKGKSWSKPNDNDKYIRRI